MASTRQISPFLKYGSAMLQIGLAAGVIYFLVRAVLGFTAPESLWEPEPMSADMISPAERSAQRAFIFTSDPFHRETAPAPIDLGIDAPETSLNLKLFGLRAGNNGSAILQTPDNKQGVYRVGDEIINGVTLKSISPEYIVLSLDGRLERLTFAGRNKTSLLASPQETSSSLLNIGSQKIEFKNLMRDVRFDKKIDRGTVQGYVITRRNANVDLEKYGLKNGDLVMAIDDINLTQPNVNMAQIGMQLASKNSANITLKRRGKTMTVKVSM